MNKKVCFLVCVGIFCIIGGVSILRYNTSKNVATSNEQQEYSLSGKKAILTERILLQKQNELSNKPEVTDGVIGSASGIYIVDEDREAIDAKLDMEEKQALMGAATRIAAKEDGLREDGAKTSYTAADLIQEIKLSSSSQQLSEKCKKILETLQKQGIDCEKILSELYKEDGSAEERMVVIKALQELATDKAKETLIEIAKNPGRTAHTLGPRAVKALTALTDDSTMISQCLESTISESRDAAAQELAGKELSSIAVSRLGELLKTNSWISHNLVATAFTTDTSKQMTHEKINLIVNTIPKVEAVITLNKDSLLVEVPWNSQEMAMQSYLSALSGIKSGKTYLENQCISSKGVTQQMIVLSLANQGEKGMLYDVRKIVNETGSGFIRTMAVNSLAHIGESGDIKLLEQIKKGDSFKRTYQAPRDSSETDHYPVREAAEKAIKMIEAKIQN